MSYISAEDVLPKEVIGIIQQYISGKSIYIPSKEKKDWGSETKIKQYKNNHSAGLRLDDTSNSFYSTYHYVRRLNDERI